MPPRTRRTTASSSGTSVPVSQVQAGTALNPTQTTHWTFTPAYTTDTLADFGTIFRPQTFGGVVETVLTFGYNPLQAITGATGESAANFIIHPDAGDSTPHAMEMEFVFHFPDGNQGIPIQMGATRDNTHSFNLTFKHGAGTSDGIGFASQSETYVSMSRTAVASAPGVLFSQPVQTPLGSVISAGTFTCRGAFAVQDASSNPLLSYNGSFEWVVGTTPGHHNVFRLNTDASHVAIFQMQQNGTTVFEIDAGNPSAIIQGGQTVAQLYSTGIVFSKAIFFASTVEFQSATGPKFNNASLFQTTVGAAGGASALPATPTKYLKCSDHNGTAFVIPMYAAA